MRHYTPYAIFECEFLLSDPRYKKLPNHATRVYVALWARAFQDRRELLHAHYDAAAIASDCAIHRKHISVASVADALQLLKTCGLIDFVADNGKTRIKVNGVKGKGNISWKDAGQTLDNTLSHESREEKKRTEKTASSSAEPPAEVPLKLHDETTSFCNWWAMTKGVRISRKFREWVNPAFDRVPLAFAGKVAAGYAGATQPWDICKKLVADWRDEVQYREKESVKWRQPENPEVKAILANLLKKAEA